MNVFILTDELIIENIKKINIELTRLRQIVGQIQQQWQQRQQQYPQESKDEYISKMEKQTEPYHKEISELESLIHIYDKILKYKQQDIIPYNYILGHICLDTNDNEKAQNIFEKFKKFIESFDFEVIFADNPIVGSWSKNFITRFKEYFDDEKLNENLKDAEHALKLALMYKIQSEIDKNQAEAAAKLIDSCKDIPKCILQIGSLVLVKYKNDDGEIITFCRTLTSKEIQLIQEKPSLLNNPNEIAKKLKSIKTETEY